MIKSEHIAILIGGLAWLCFSLVSLPISPKSLTYVQILILAAPLWLIPLLWRLLDTPDWVQYISISSSIFLLIAFCLSPSPLVAILSVPWLLLTTAIAFQKLKDWRISKSMVIHHLCQLAGYLYLPIGAAWAFADRLGFQPLSFDTTIVLLTVAHFHYAGFILPTITAFALPNISLTYQKLVGWSVILGIPLVAIGITTSHLDLPVWIEVLAVTVMVIGGLTSGFAHIILGWKNLNRGYGKLWLLAGLALMIGMMLALGYGWRHYYLIPALSIPWMYAVHGSLNAIGFALPAILGWFYFSRSNRI